jgi:hypothetical protein
MEHIFDTINPTEWFTTTNGIIASLMPVIVILLGILVAFFIIDSIVGVFRIQEIPKHDRKTNYDDDDDDDDFDY